MTTACAGAVMKQPVNSYKAPGHDDSVPHEGPLWHDDDELKRYTCDSFKDGVEAISSEEFAEIDNR